MIPVMKVLLVRVQVPRDQETPELRLESVVLVMVLGCGTKVGQ